MPKLDMNHIRVADIEVAYRDLGRGPIVLLVHGFPLDHTMWSAQVTALCPHARVIAPDLRGFGRTSLGDVDPSVGVEIGRYADDLALFLDALGVNEPISFCGFSMGGYIAWQFAEKYPARLARLVLCDTRAAADAEEARAGRLKMADHVAEWGAARVAEIMVPKLFAAESFTARPEQVEEVRQVIGRTPPASIAVAQRAMAGRPDVTDMLPNIAVPSLVLVGSQDVLSSPDEMRQIAAAMPAAQFVEVPAAGHMAPMESPPAFNGAVLEFIGASA